MPHDASRFGRSLWLAISAAAVCAFTGHAVAASFVDARYDREADELVVTLAYRGTNPNHSFTIEWEECETATPEGHYEIAARVLDSQWNDAAREPFQSVVRFPLHDLGCRPATVTLFTEPNFRISVAVPARART